MKRTTQFIAVIVFLSVLLPYVGCRGTRIPGLAKCEGTVLWNGNPVEGATVGFSPKDPAGRSAFGVTDAAGKFKITTLDANDGIAPGEYLVSVKKQTSVREGGGVDPQNPRAGAVAPERIVITHYIPQVYADKATSGFSATIPPNGTKDLLFELVGEVPK